MIFRGIRTVVTVLVLCAFSLTYIAIPAQAYTTNLSSQDFSKMYYFASKGDAQRLSMAISRGLNINATNINGDTGLCVAVRNQNITAYKTFRAVGANPRPECSWRIPHFDQFVISHQMTNGSYYARQTVFPTAKRGYRNVASTAAEKISTGSNAWYWIGGAALVGGGVALAAGGGGGGGSSGGDSSGDDNNENICDTNPCAEGCYRNIPKPGDDYECTKSNSCGGCEEWKITDICANNSCAEGCYTNIPDPEDDSTCTNRNSCGGCEVWTCPQETPKPTGNDKTYKCTAYYQCENGTRCKKWEEVDPFAKDATESTEDTVTNNESIAKDGTNISGTWGGIYSAQKAVENTASITLTGGSNAVGIMSAASKNLNTARESEITTAGGNINNTGDITINADNSVGIFATTLGTLDENSQLTNVGSITNETDATISLNGQDNTGIELVGDGNVTNRGNIILIGSGTNIGILHKSENKGYTTTESSTITNDGDISVTGAGEIYGIKAGDDATISGAGDITLNGTNTDDGNPQTMYGIYAEDNANITYTGNIKNESTDTNVTMIALQAGDSSEATNGTNTDDGNPQTMYGIYAGNNANITYTGNIKNESTDTNVTMIAVQAGENSTVTLGEYNPDTTEKTQVEGDISLGKGSTLTNVQNTITGNIRGGNINNQSSGIITGDINTTGIIFNDSGSEIKVGNERTITAEKINNLGTIGTSEDPFTSITVTGIDIAPDDGNAFYNEYIVYGNISAENGTVFNSHDATITGNITAKSISNSGTIGTSENPYTSITVTGDDSVADNGNAFYNEYIVYGNISAENGTVSNSRDATITGNITAKNLINSDGVITGNINITSRLNNDGTIQGNIGEIKNQGGYIGAMLTNNGGAIINGNINVGYIKNYGSIGNSEDEVASNDITVSGGDQGGLPSAGNYLYAALYNGGAIYSNELKVSVGSIVNFDTIVAQNINVKSEIINEASEENKGKITADTITANTIINGNADKEKANIKASTISATNITNNNGLIEGAIRTETLNNNTLGAGIDSRELMARTINNSGIIAIENGRLAANTINNEEENGDIGQIRASAGMSFRPMSDGNGNGADITLTDVLTFNSQNNLAGTFINIGNDLEGETEYDHKITLNNIDLTSDSELTGIYISSESNKMTTSINGLSINEEDNLSGNIIGIQGDHAGTIAVDGLNVYGYNSTGINADSSTVKIGSVTVKGDIITTGVKLHDSVFENLASSIIDVSGGNATGIEMINTTDNSKDISINVKGTRAYGELTGIIFKLDTSSTDDGIVQWNSNYKNINLTRSTDFGEQSSSLIGINIENESGDRLEVTNSANITINNGQNADDKRGTGKGVNISADYDIFFENKGNITLQSLKSAFGISLFGKAGGVNTGTIHVQASNAYGVYADECNDTTFTNQGNIDVRSSDTGYGMYGTSGDADKITLINDSQAHITLLDNSNGTNIGMYGSGEGTKLVNNGSIIGQGNSSWNNQIKVENNATCEGEGCTAAASTAQAFMLMRGARMYNSGTISQDSEMNFDEMGDGTGEVYFGKTAVFEAPSVSGTAIAMADHTTGSNEDSYTTTGNFVADNVDVNVKSGTAMFMARSSGSGVRMQRIAFTNLLQDKELANYLESNYQSGNRVDLFDDLKQANDNNSLYDAAKRALGHEFFPLLAWQNQQRVRHFNHTMEDLVLDDDTLKSERTVAKFDSNYTEQDAANGLPGYEDKIYGVSGLFDKEVNKNYRFGVGIGLYNAYAEFDDDDTRRDAIVQAYQTNRFDYDNWGALVMPFAGYSRGEYKRYATSGKYEPHFNVWYLGLNNRAYLKQDLGNWRIEPTVEINLSSIYQDKVKEDNNITVKGQNSLSVEAGAGAYAKRKYDLGENGALEIKGGAMYYRELNSKAYDDYSAQMYGMDGNYHVSGYENDRNRAELSFKADYKIGKWSVYGEVSQSFADNDNTVYNAGIRLAF